jgi:hypothetical protein
MGSIDVAFRRFEEISRHLTVLRARAHARSGWARDLWLGEIAEVEKDVVQLKVAVESVHRAAPRRRASG